MAVMKDRVTGRPSPMQINGRHWGTLQFTVDASVDIPRLLLTVATGESAGEPPTYQLGIRLLWERGYLDHLLSRLRESDETLQLPIGSPSRLAAILQALLLGGLGDF